jgi:quinol monooxygenase YgiN
MHIVHVDIRVKPDSVDAFIEVTKDNASNSIEEAGILRFDLLQDKDDPTHFMLYEVYLDAADHAAHRETAHYARWAAATPAMIAADRVATKLSNLLPADDQWNKGGI